MVVEKAEKKNIVDLQWRLFAPLFFYFFFKLMISQWYV